MTEPDESDDPFAPKKKGMDRRQFVKTAIGAATVGALGATGAGLVIPLSTAGGLKIRHFPYFGARRIGGPAPQGIPLIPLKINGQGEIEGNPQLGAFPEGKEPHSLEWYKYCSHEGAPGLKDGFTDDNVLRYYNNPVKVAAAEAQGIPIWYKDRIGDRVRADHFTEINQGAPFRWRSEDQEQNNIITGIIIKVGNGNVKNVPQGFMAEDFIAFCSFCAHFCCVPGYQESNIPQKAGLFDKIYCTCHDSVYDPRELRAYTFPPNQG